MRARTGVTRGAAHRGRAVGRRAHGRDPLLWNGVAAASATGRRAGAHGGHRRGAAGQRWGLGHRHGRRAGSGGVRGGALLLGLHDPNLEG